MSIPRIDPYSLPQPHELPKSRAPWSPEPARAALLIHDMQRYFLDFYDASRSPARPLFENLQRLRELCLRRGVPVLYSAQPASGKPGTRGLLNDLWGPGLLAQPDRGDIVPELSPVLPEALVHKTRYSALHGTELLSRLRDQGRDQLWIGGVYAHIGCAVTASEAFMHDVKPFLISDASADFSRAHHDRALQFVAGCCGAVIDTETLCRALQAEAGQERDGGLLHEALHELGVNVEGLRDDSDLRDAGLDSVRLLELSELLLDRGLRVSMVDMLEHPTLGGMRRYVQQAPRAEGGPLALGGADG